MSVGYTAGSFDVSCSSVTDAFGRKTSEALHIGMSDMVRQFTYHAGQVTAEHTAKNKVKGTPTTYLVSQLVLTDAAATETRTLSYEYDGEERITKVIDSLGDTTEYTYDALGQLLTEKVNGTIVNSMTYDNYGNILTKNGVTYTYGDSVWKDKLTSYGGQAISYDAQGNPTTYLGHTLTWEKGRQLKSFDSHEYTYNANGIRTSKMVNGLKHIYTLDGTNILKETWGENTLIPMYDNEDSVCGIIYNEEPYFFHKSLQGDVIAITDKDGQVVARYSYDAWGVCSVTADTSECGIAGVNPYRYRGYYYDTETGLYYLQSRYYNPVVGRFVNGDKIECATIASNVLYGNLYCYCCNNPVNEIDQDGTVVLWVLKKILIGAIKGFLTQFCIDLIEWAFKNYVSGRKSSFAISHKEDYLAEILSQIFSEFKLSNIVGTSATIVCLFIKYIPKIVGKRMGKKEWGNLFLDVMATVINVILNRSLNRLKNKRAQLRKQRARRPWNKAISIAIKHISIRIKYKGILIDVCVPISKQLISSAINILF